MAITHFTFCEVGQVTFNAQIPAAKAASFSSEGIVPSGSNQQTTAAAATSGKLSLVCRVATDTAVYVAFGSNPNALSGTGTRALLPAGAVDYFIVAAGDKAAEIGRAHV